MPHLLAVGGSLRAGSVSTAALEACAHLARRAGATVTVLSGEDLRMPPYEPDSRVRTPEALRLVTALRDADGLILAAPAYHGGLSGLVKNALDYAEDLSRDSPPYLENRVAGCLAVGAGDRGAATALESMRTTLHALRAWTAPMGVIVNGLRSPFVGDVCTDDKTARRLRILVDQVVEHATRPAPYVLSEV
ncbi:NADPH-dependent FMN reductase [Microbispora sp. NPDC049125]|uniref:NADPH-dependent FMN reductase n=1 Tax=Microbispora sp. NPDC049125 TaxID=3154929 RepID=UPI00346739F7